MWNPSLLCEELFLSVYEESIHGLDFGLPSEYPRFSTFELMGLTFIYYFFFHPLSPQLRAFKCARFCKSLSGFVRYCPLKFLHSDPREVDTVLVAPLGSTTDLELPPHLEHTHKVRLVPDLGVPTLRGRPLRRAEFSVAAAAAANTLSRHSRDTVQTRLIQTYLYQFALNSCLGGLPHQTTSNRSCCLLDVACGALVPFGCNDLAAKLRANGWLLLGLDVILPSTLDPTEEQYIRCSLDGLRALPLRSGIVDFVVSISFLQWLIAASSSSCHTSSSILNSSQRSPLRSFIHELVRVVRPFGGHGILQFYPTCPRDLDVVCEALVHASPSLRGCRIRVRPVPQRGQKIFVYFIRK
ncbi:18S rRNA (guanine1575-N7)-methyltransferase [Sparganum proliferum]